MRDIAAVIAWFREHDARSPITEHLRFTHAQVDGEALFRLDPTPAGGVGAGDARPHQNAVLTFIDNSLGLALAAESRPIAPATTIDLRVDWCAALEQGPVWCAVETRQPFHGTAISQATLWQESRDIPCALATGRFMLNVLPGGGDPHASGPAQETIPVPDADRFESFVGFDRSRYGRVSLPPAPHLLGMVKAGTFHGGIVAALCDEAGRAAIMTERPKHVVRCATLEIEYLRPALADAALEADVSLLRLDEDVAIASVTARGSGNNTPPLAAATLLYALSH